MEPSATQREYTRNGVLANLQVNRSFRPGNGQVAYAEPGYAWEAFMKGSHNNRGGGRAWRGRTAVAIP